MTFSLVARCPRTGELGVGALTAMIGVGKLVPHVAAGVGAIASQAMVNPYLGIDGVRLLRNGLTPQQTLDELVSADPGRDVRQVGVIDGQGRVAAWTGQRASGWAGHHEGAGVIAQGNRLAGEEVLTAALTAFHESPDRALVERLLLGLEAGERAGGDTEGEFSGALVVHAEEEYPLWDVRVDHHDDPVEELRRLYEDMEEQLLPEVLRLPTRDDPMGEAAREALQQSES